MKNINMKKMTFLLALSLVLVGCQTEQKEDTKEETKIEQTDQTKVESEEETNKESEKETNKESEKETKEVVDNSEEDNNSEDEKILSNISNLFDKYNYSLEHNLGGMYVSENKSIKEVSIQPDMIQIGPSQFTPGEYIVGYSKVVERSDASYEKIVKDFSPLVEEEYGISQKEFNDKAIEEYNSSQDKGNFLFNYKRNPQDFTPISIAAYNSGENDLYISASLPGITSEKENTEAFTDIAYRFAGKGTKFISPDNGYIFNVYQLNNKAFSGLTGDMETGSNNDLQDPQSLEDSLKMLEEMGKKLESDDSSSYDGTSLGVTSLYSAANLRDEDLDGKKRDEVYSINLSITGDYGIEFDKFTEELDKTTEKFPQEFNKKIEDIKNIMKKQYESKGLNVLSKTNTVLGKGFVVTTNSNVLNENDFETVITLYLDEAGNLVDMSYLKDIDSYNEHINNTTTDTIQ